MVLFPKKKNMKINIRIAVPSDSEELIQLTMQTPMEGSISIRIDRDPDFFSLSKARGETEVFVACIENNNLIIGCFSFSKQLFYSFGKPVDVYYLADLKIRPEYSKSFAAYLLAKHVQSHLQSIGANFLFCTAVNDNYAVMPFFNGRATIPKFQKLATFNSYQILPRKGKKHTPADINHFTLIDFYMKSYKNYSFYSSFNDLGQCKHFVNIENDQVSSSMSVFDPSALKKNVTVKVRFAIKLLLKILRLLKYVFPLSDIPSLNKPLKILFIKYYACQKDNDAQFVALLDQVRAYAFANQYHLLSIAADERNLAINCLLKSKSITRLVSIGLITSLDNDQELLNLFSKGLCYEDFSLS
jgi:hypothetical protein